MSKIYKILDNKFSDLMDTFDSVALVSNGLYVNGVFYDWPRGRVKHHNVKQIYGHLYVDGFELKLDGWHRTLKSIFENWI